MISFPRFEGKISAKPLGQSYYIPFLFSFWGIIFGNFYRKLHSMIFLGELITVM